MQGASLSLATKSPETVTDLEQVLYIDHYNVYES